MISFEVLNWLNPCHVSRSHCLRMTCGQVQVSCAAGGTERHFSLSILHFLLCCDSPDDRLIGHPWSHLDWCARSVLVLFFYISIGTVCTDFLGTVVDAIVSRATSSLSNSLNVLSAGWVMRCWIFVKSCNQRREIQKRNRSCPPDSSRLGNMFSWRGVSGIRTRLSYGRRPTWGSERFSIVHLLVSNPWPSGYGIVLSIRY